MCGSGSRKTLSLYVSDNMEDWETVGVIYEISDDSWSKEDTWAGEIHIYKGKFYLFVSSMGKHGLRGTQIAVCDRIDGKYVPIANRPITPIDMGCIDATLFVNNDVPYIIFSRDWPTNYCKERDCYIGQIWAAEVTEDLKDIKGEPFLLFNSDDAPLSKMFPSKLRYFNPPAFTTRYGSDAPYVVKLSNGALFLTWSPEINWNYMVLGAISRSGDMRGPWEHLPVPVYDNNGGHCMFFKDFDGTIKIALHGPEATPETEAGRERVLIYEMRETENGYVLKDRADLL
jgi:hypothetical protein